ncbi:acyltransferase [Hymenobacter setariae]|uniref:Acyltransferase n=1 Tax=Hymenobacter setariae TaxID=2594794 RepID=A0A558C2L7_9BACT|nr:acyltransferase [Hymenobacter setariae]TVT43050.1 acyltransferase [Hymenobacter setariae]
MVTTSSKSASYFPALTGIRAVAALLVFFFHAVPEAPADVQIIWLKWPGRLAQQGYIGVSIFFVLSGFLIAIRNFDRVQLTGIWFKHYVQNRFARIYPLYFLLTAFTFAVMLVHPFHTWYEWSSTSSSGDKAVIILANLTLVRAFFNEFVFVGVPTAWTLTIEETFYLSAPFLLLGLKHSIRWFYTYPVLFILSGLLLVLVCERWLPHYGLMANLRFMLSETFFGRCVEFLIGIGLAWWVHRRPMAQGVSRGGSTTLLGCAGIVSCLLLLLWLERSLPINSWVAFSINRLLTNIMLPLPIAIMLWGLLYERTWLRRILESKTAQLLGKSSYAFYLIHLGTLDTIFSVYVTGNVVARLCAYTLLAILLYKWVEHPLHKLLRAPSEKRPLVVSV